MPTNQEIKPAASHPGVPRPSNDELVKLAFDVCMAIEACGTSDALSRAVVLASDLHTYLRKPDVEKENLKARLAMKELKNVNLVGGSNV